MDLSWYIRRLRAMSVPEVAYRIQQKHLREKERKMFASRRPVFEVRDYGAAPKPNFSVLGLVFENRDFTVGGNIELLGPYEYADYRTRWLAAFQSAGDWPDRFASDYDFGAEDAPGDIRTNWELNRHRQFALLAKSWYVTGENCYIEELECLFDNFNAACPFMWGPEWSSPMELSIRLVNWLVTAAFLDAAAQKNEKSRKLAIRLADGAWAMAGHVRSHYSRYSSANNHAIVEAAGVAIAGVVFGQEDWLSEALSILEAEVVRQTFPDGVNKEQALHYQLFVMESLCLVSHALRTSGQKVPQWLFGQLRLMAGYVRACYVGNGRYIEFGDDDEGAILCLSGAKPVYGDHVLSLVTMEVDDGQRWVEDVACCETIRWLYPETELFRAQKQSLVQLEAASDFPYGGVSVIRKGGFVLAFDHGPLGLDPLAAHGHADALSIQLYLDGEPVLIDPGTYVYNGNRKMRDLYRSTRAHNAACIAGENQSEILGPFLWGRRARVSRSGFCQGPRAVIAMAMHDGYGSSDCVRQVEVSEDGVDIIDTVEGAECHNAVAYLHLPLPPENMRVSEHSISLELSSGLKLMITMSSNFNINPFEWSPAYGALRRGTEVAISFDRDLETEVFVLGGTR